jgi:uncharacterized protein YecT (DUF1311 family)
MRIQLNGNFAMRSLEQLRLLRPRMPKLGLLALMLGTHVAIADECADTRTSEAIVECMGKDLRAADAKINASYQELMGSLAEPNKTQLREDQRTWIHERDANCDLGKKATDRDQWYESLLKDYAKTLCVTRYTRERTIALDAMLSGLPGHAAAADAGKPAQAAPIGQQTDYQVLSAGSRTTGRWYFEVTMNPKDIASTPTAVWWGCRIGYQSFGSLSQIHAADAALPVARGGIALDLEAGKLYVRKDGVWVHGAPDSSGGVDLKLGRAYRCGLETTVGLATMIANGSLRLNFGKEKFDYAMPGGYRSFSDDGS